MIYNQLAKAGASFPNQIAIVDNAREFTYSQLLHSVEEMSLFFEAKGIQPKNTIAIHIPNSLEFIVSFFAATKIGTNILLLDASLKPNEIDNYLQQTTSSFLLYKAPLNDNKYYPTLKHPVATLMVPHLAKSDRNPFTKDTPLTRDQQSSVFYLLSSGSTGIPKVIVRSSKQTLAAINIFQNTIPYRHDDKVIALLPFTHSFGFLNILLHTLSNGASLYIESFSPRSVSKIIKEQAITILPGTPFLFRMLNETHFRDQPDFSSVRIAITAGSSLPLSISNRFRDKFELSIFQSYGTTETGPAAIAYFDDSVKQPGWVGKPYQGVAFEIYDPEGNPLPPDKQGRLAVKSPANTKGYLNHPQANTEIFLNGSILTGDLGFQDTSGNIFVLGRERPMINVAGKKVSPAEVETCIRNHPNVADVMVFGEKGSTGDEIVKAIIVPSGNVTALEIRQFCTKNMADFKAPRSIEFVNNLSQGVMGKIKCKPPDKLLS